MCPGRTADRGPIRAGAAARGRAARRRGRIHIPAALSLLWKGPYDWDYSTVPQGKAASRSIYWPRGKTLGGSSSLNAMIYIRGNRYDYDTWRDEYGCAGWGYADLLPYFIRAEDNSRGASAYHGAGGPLRVQDAQHSRR